MHGETRSCVRRRLTQGKTSAKTYTHLQIACMTCVLEEMNGRAMCVREK